MCVTICGRFCSDEGVVAGYSNQIRAKYTAKWGVQHLSVSVIINLSLFNDPAHMQNFYLSLQTWKI